MRRKALAIPLAAVFLLYSCSAATAQAYINLAVGIALQIAQLAGLSPSAAGQVSGDLAVVNKFIADYKAADANAKPGILAEIDTYLTTAENDLMAILTASHVTDPKKQEAIRAGIAIAVTAVESIRALEGAHPNAVARAARTVPGVPKRSGSPAQLKNLYNQTVRDYPQAQLH